MFCDPQLQLSPVTYLHWHGHLVGSLLGDLYERMEGRRGDLTYVAARFVGLCHEKIEGNLSLGMWNAPTPEDLFERTSEYGWTYSHGDAGVFIVDCAFKQVVMFGGYGFEGYTSRTGDSMTVPWEKVPKS